MSSQLRTFIKTEKPRTRRSTRLPDVRGVTAPRSFARCVIAESKDSPDVILFEFPGGDDRIVLGFSVFILDSIHPEDGAVPTFGTVALIFGTGVSCENSLADRLNLFEPTALGDYTTVIEIMEAVAVLYPIRVFDFNPRPAGIPNGLFNRLLPLSRFRRS